MRFYFLLINFSRRSAFAASVKRVFDRMVSEMHRNNPKLDKKEIARQCNTRVYSRGTLCAPFLLVADACRAYIMLFPAGSACRTSRRQVREPNAGRVHKCTSAPRNASARLAGESPERNSFPRSFLGFSSLLRSLSSK